MRVVGRVDEVEPKAVAAEIVDRGVQVAADDLALAQPFLAGFFAFAAGLASAFPAAALAAALLAGSLFTGLAGLERFRLLFDDVGLLGRRFLRLGRSDLGSRFGDLGGLRLLRRSLLRLGLLAAWSWPQPGP